MSDVKTLYRDTKNSQIAGVCAGLADYFNIDVSLVRLLTVASVFVGGAGIVFYIAAWIIVPEKP